MVLFPSHSHSVLGGSTCGCYGGFLWIHHISTRRIVDDTDGVVHPPHPHSPSVDDVAEGCGAYLPKVGIYTIHVNFLFISL